MGYFSPYIDDSGLHMPTYQDILDDIIAQMKNIYGQDIYLGNDSADYQFISILALKISDSYQAVQYAYNSRSPETAMGAALDSVVKLNGIKRKEAGYSTCQVVISGNPFTEIRNGSVKDAAGNVWDLPSSVVIGSDGRVTTTVTCEAAGAVSALPGDITKINTPTYGWTSVENKASAAVGNAIETDGELRTRQAISVANPSQTMLAGTLGALRALDNVKRVSVYENDTNISTVDTDNNPFGLPPHSITCVVEGGDDNEIAQTILYHKGIGCYTNGSTEITFKDQNDYVNKVRFYRPTYVPVHVKLQIKKYAGYIANYIEPINDAIYKYIEGLEIGRDVSVSMLSGIIMNCNPNPKNPLFGISSITIGKDDSSLAAADLDINYNEVAQPDYSLIEVKIL